MAWKRKPKKVGSVYQDDDLTLQLQICDMQDMQGMGSRPALGETVECSSSSSMSHFAYIRLTQEVHAALCASLDTPKPMPTPTSTGSDDLASADDMLSFLPHVELITVAEASAGAGGSASGTCSGSGSIATATVPILRLHAHTHPLCVLHCILLPPQVEHTPHGDTTSIGKRAGAGAEAGALIPKVYLTDVQRCNQKLCVSEIETFHLYRGETFVYDAREACLGTDVYLHVHVHVYVHV